MTAAHGNASGTVTNPARLHDRLASLEQENAALRRQLGQSQTLLAHGPLVLFRWSDPLGEQAEDVSPNVIHLLGYGDDEFTSGRVTYRSLIHPDDRERVADEIQGRCAAGAATIEQEYRVLHAGGATRWVSNRTLVARDAQGAITHSIGYLLDITERKLAEEALHEQIRSFQTVIDHLPIAVFVKDAQDRRFVVWNKTAEQIMGYTTEQALGQTHHAFFPPEQAALFDRQDDALLARGEPVDLPCVTFQNKRLGPRLLHTIKAPVYDRAGRPRYVVGISEDITRHRQIEEELAQQVALLTNLINTLPFPVFYKDTEGVYRSCNRVFAEELMGRPVEEVLGRTRAEIIAPEAAAQAEAIERSLHTQAGDHRVELELPYADGRLHTVIFQLSAFSRPDGSPGGVLGAMLDITDFKRAEAEKHDLQQQIIAAQQAAIRELSAPLLPLAPHVVALPLIGVIDSARAQQITETLLEGITAQQADVAIMDITGVQVVDTQVANAVLRAARAARLLGAQVVLTGIRPEVAQTLVQLGIELEGIVTRSTFQSAIEYALLKR